MQIDISQEKRKELIKNRKFFDLFCSVSRIEKALSLTRGGIWELDTEEWPFQLAGTFAPVRFESSLYLITAKHVAQNMRLQHNQAMYYLSDGRFFSYDFVINETFNNQLDEDYFDDFVLLKVSRDGCCVDFENENGLFVFNIDNEVSFKDCLLDVYIRGCPSPVEFSGTMIDAEKQKISQQCFMTNGYLNIREEQGCFYLKMKNPTSEEFANDPQGMSGTVVYGVNDQCLAGILGIIIGFNKITMEYQVLPAKAICEKAKNLLKKEK